jgi:hypothetical protein
VGFNGRARSTWLMLAKVKVGDRVDITWTEALILSIDEAK